MPRTLALVALLFVPIVADAQVPTTIPDPDPELERKTFVVPEGFEVNLFAADPMLAKPIQMNFDPQGRLWVAASEVYPQIKPGQKPTDRVLILEDTNADGKADKTTVFADGLLIPTGVAPGDGGAYVADSTDIVHFSDPDPTTGKARKKRIVLSGFGTEDTHHIVHTFRWGPDGHLYFNQSIYIHSHIETPYGVRHLNAGGVWRFRPETTDLGIVARGFVNPWGHQFDRWGQTFATDGAYGEGVNILMPGAYYVTNGYGVGRLLAGLNPGSPKHCGLAVLSGRHLPSEYQGNMVTNDFRGHRVCRFVLREDGSGYQSQEKQEIIKSAHPAFRPIDVAMGPDGAIYVADWYNPIIQHGEVDFRDPRRDKTHGRIWRITAKGRPLVVKPKLVGTSVSELLEHLKSPEDWTRDMAKQLLRERGAAAVTPALDEWVKSLDRNDPGFIHHMLEALWAYQSVGVVQPQLLEVVLNAPDHRARAAACRVVAAWAGREFAPSLRVTFDPDRLKAFDITSAHATEVLAKYHGTPGATAEGLADVVVKMAGGQKVHLRDVARVEVGSSSLSYADALHLLASRVFDDHPQVRLDAVRALGVLPSVQAAQLAAKALDKPVDKWLDYGLWLTFRELAPHWLPEVQAGRLDFDGNPRHLVFALQASGSGDIAQPLLGLLKAGKLAKDRETDVWETVARIGGPNDLLAVLNAARAPGLPDDARGRLLAAVEDSVRQRKVTRPDGLTATALRDVITRPNGPAAASALRLAGLWGMQDMRPVLEAVSSAKESDPAAARGALDGLARLGGSRSSDHFRKLSAADRPTALRQAVVEAWAGANVTQAAPAAVELLASAQSSPELADVFAAFVGRKGGPAALAAALAGKRLAPDVAKIGLRAAKATGQADPALVAALTQAGGLTEARLTLAGADLQRFLADAAKLGDPVRGEQVYRRTELTCLKCHAVAGAGGQVGPDLTSIGASAPPDYLVDSLLNPSGKIKEGFNTKIVTTVDDRVFTGIVVRETPTELVLRDAEDKEIILPAADVASKKDGKSLMPEGLVDSLTRQELLDLTRFLSELGKGSYLATAGKRVRRWQVLQPTKESAYLLNRQRLAAVAVPDATLTWMPAYSLVSGDLPLAAVPTFKAGQTTGQAGVARFQVEVTTPGTVRLVVNDPTGLTLWMDGVPADTAKETMHDLLRGVHTVTIAVDAAKRSGPLRVELEEVPGSPARARVQGGK